jgi:hypothetical protein
MIETKESRAKWLKEHEAAKAAFRAIPLGRRPVKGISDDNVRQSVRQSEPDVRQVDKFDKKAYQREYMRRRRKKVLDTPKGV